MLEDTFTTPGEMISVNRRFRPSCRLRRGALGWEEVAVPERILGGVKQRAGGGPILVARVGSTRLFYITTVMLTGRRGCASPGGIASVRLNMGIVGTALNHEFPEL